MSLSERAPTTTQTIADRIAETYREATHGNHRDPVEYTTNQHAGVSFAGAGNDRTAFYIEDSVHEYSHSAVVKVPITKYQANVNLKEYRTWESVSEYQVGRNFAPVFDVEDSGEWLVQRRVRDAHTTAHIELREKFDARGIPYGDVETYNVGVMNGRDVIYDFPWGEVSVNPM